MWPFSRQARQYLFDVECLVLGVRAPSAMFSRSRYTAMVHPQSASLGHHCPNSNSVARHRPEFAPAVRNTQAGKLRCIALTLLKPVVVEAHTDAFGRLRMGRHLVAQPTLDRTTCRPRRAG